MSNRNQNTEKTKDGTNRADSGHSTISIVPVLLGVVAVVSALAIIFAAYRYMLTSTENRFAQVYLDKSRMLYAPLEYHQNDSDERMLGVFRVIWGVGDKPRDEHLCVFDLNGKVLLHTGNQLLVGTDASDSFIEGDESGRIHTLRDLIDSRSDFRGIYQPIGGKKQVAAFAWVPNRRWVLGVLRSKEALVGEARQEFRSFGLAFLGVCGLMTLSLLLLQRTIGVTQKRRQAALDDLRESEEKFRTLAETAAAAIFIRRGSRYRFVNPGMQQITGYSSDELLEMDFLQIIHPNCRELVLERTASQQRGEVTPSRREVQLITKDGRECWIDLTIGMIDFEGEPSYIGTAFDITERKRLEEDLWRLAAIVEFSEDAIVGKNLDGEITSWNDGAEKIYGYSADEVVGKSISILLPPDRPDEMHEILGRVSQGENVVLAETVRVRKDGTSIHVSLTISPIRDSDGKPVGVSAIARDITHRKNLEREILESTGREQQRIGRELHDSLGQELTGLSYLARSLSQRLESNESSESESAEKIATGIQHAIGEVRAAIRGLAPVEVDANGLTVALERLVASTSDRCDIDCRLVCDRDVPVEDNTVATHLFRIAQEAINNAVKHAKAQHITLNLESQNGRLTLQGRDDGIGFETDSSGKLGMGLRIMQYRAGLIGATLDVQSASGSGTVITCTLSTNGQNGRKANEID